MTNKQKSDKHRPPIIAVLGHVDHGKTSLLDYIRKTNVAAGESGGITQHTGAYQALANGRLLTLIDTPGHEAFSAMRQRGGQIADLVILVVAADDGVMPQTRESLIHIKNAGIPFVVAVNKIDLPQANPDQIKAQLAQEGILVEGYGGSVPIAMVSAKTGAGVDALLELVLLMADMEELTADPESPLEAFVVESSLDQHKGPLATLVIKNGTLRVSDQLKFDQTNKPIKVKALLDWRGDKITSAGPSTPVLVLGFNRVLPVGAKVTTGGVEAAAPVLDKAEMAHEFVLPILIKTDVVGTLEAILGSLPPEIEVLDKGTGAINESDISLAQTTKATIIGFKVKPTPAAKKLASIEKIKIYTFNTIYDLLNEIKNMIGLTREANKRPGPTGTAKVIQIFMHEGKKIVGAKVTMGQFTLEDQVEARRGEKLLGTAKATSLRVGRENKKKITLGQEFGVIFEPELDILEGDELSSQSKADAK